MSKPTPGPWEWDDTVWDYDPEDQAPWLVGPSGGLGDTVLRGQIVCSEPNAYLIAAAPELLDALESLLVSYPEWVADDESLTERAFGDILRAAHAAVKKAKGFCHD